MATTKINPAKDILPGTLPPTILANTAAPGTNNTTIATTAFVTNGLSTKQNTLTTGTTSQYFRGDLSLATFPTTLSLSSLTPATSSNTLNNNAGFQQTWLWDGTPNICFDIESGHTLGSLAGTRTLLRGLTAGTAASGVTSIAGNFEATITGTSSTNIALKIRSIGGTNNYALITYGGNSGFNVSNPTALVHLGAGSASAGTAPLKFTSGTLMSAPETGAIEFDGTHLYCTIGSSRYQLDQQGGGVSSAFGRTGAVIATSGDYTVAQITGAAPLASPTFTGTPVAPTASTGTNTTQVATTAFVQQELTASTSYFGPMFAGAGTSGDPIIPIAAYNNQTGTTYTLVSGDNGKVVTLTNASAITLTVPASLPAGFNCSIVQLGAGQVTIAASGTTINNRQSFTKIAGRYGAATILQYATNTFLTQGDMSA